MEPDRGKSSRRNASLAWDAGKDILGPLRRGCLCSNPEGGVPIWQRWRMTKAGVDLLGTFPNRDRTVARKRNVEDPEKSWAWCKCSPRNAAGSSRAVLARGQQPDRNGLESQATGSSQTTQRLRFGRRPALRCVGVRHDGSMSTHRTIWSRCSAR